MGGLWQAVGLFAVTNIDDIVILSLFYGRARSEGRGALQISIGQYLGFLVILVMSAAGALGAGLLPGSAIRYLGIIPILIGARAGWTAWNNRRRPRAESSSKPPDIATVAGVTFANGGDNIGVYIPAFATVSKGILAGYLVVFLIMVAAWCLAAHGLIGHPRIADWIRRWGHVIYPIALVTIGTHILVSG